MAPHWMIWSQMWRGFSSTTYSSESEALNEAKRLARQSPGLQFYVMRSVFIVSIHEQDVIVDEIQ